MRMTNWIRLAVERVRGWSRTQKLLAALVVLAAVLVLVGQPRTHTALQTKSPEPTDAIANFDEPSNVPDGKRDRQVDSYNTKEVAGIVASDEAQLELKSMTRAPAKPAPKSFAVEPTPMVAHSAELAVATKEFVKSRETMEEILERHRGYAAKLRMVGQKSGSVLAAMLRVPSTELGGTVSDLKSLGDVEREEQNADEITQQHADIEARLLNAQNTLRRLQELLKKQDYPDGNVRELQRQIAAASAEVNRLEAERHSSENRVVFANLKFTLREEIATPAETFGAQIRHAAGEGLGDAAASVTALLVFLIGRGPALVLWAAILFVPARWLWKKWTPRAGQTAPITSQA